MDSYMNDVFLTYELFYFVLETSIAFKISLIYIYIYIYIFQVEDSPVIQ